MASDFQIQSVGTNVWFRELDRIATYLEMIKKYEKLL